MGHIVEIVCKVEDFGARTCGSHRNRKVGRKQIGPCIACAAFALNYIGKVVTCLPALVNVVEFDIEIRSHLLPGRFEISVRVSVTVGHRDSSAQLLIGSRNGFFVVSDRNI